MTHPPWMEASLDRQIPGRNRLQICGLFAQFCRDLQNYLVDSVDVATSSEQFETRLYLISLLRCCLQRR